MSNNDAQSVCGTPFFQHAENVSRCVRILQGSGTYDDYEEVQYFFNRHEDCPKLYRHLFKNEVEYRAFCFLRADWDRDKQQVSSEDVAGVERRFNELKAVPLPVMRVRFCCTSGVVGNCSMRSSSAGIVVPIPLIQASTGQQHLLPLAAALWAYTVHEVLAL